MLTNIKEELGIVLQPTTFHLFIYGKLKNKESKILNKYRDNIIKRKDVLDFFRIQNIPKKCQSRFLKELQGYGLVKIVNKNSIEIVY